MVKELNDKPKQRRGFACMNPDQVKSICAMGGMETSRKYGKKHMSRIGKHGRNVRTWRERKARKAANVNASLQDQDA